MSAAYAPVLRALGERAVPLDDRGSARLGRPPVGKVVRSDVVTAMASEGLVSVADGLVRRTAEGRAYLRRALAAAADNPHAEQHRVRETRVVSTREGAVSVTGNAAESALAFLATRRDRQGNPLISDVQRRAGERLATDHERGHQQPALTASWDPAAVKGSGRRDGLTVSEAAADARRRVDDALKSVGPGLDVVLVGVCCEGLGLEAIERRHAWPARSGKVVLQLALDRLAEHYGMASSAVGGPRRRLVHWGTADYRPSA